MVKALRFLPMFLVMAAIFFLSAQPGGTLPMPSFPGADKLAHSIAYATLAATVIYAFSPKRRPVVCALIAILISAAYGASDEWHQGFTPGRDVSFYDFLADCFGAALLAGGWLLWLRARRGGSGQKIQAELGRKKSANLLLPNKQP